MKIDRIQISVAELCRGYEERGTAVSYTHLTLPTT